VAHVTDRQTSLYAEITAKTKPHAIQIRAGVLEVNPTGGPSGGDDHGKGLTIADLANIHEFGLGVPERSFVRAWVDGSTTKINAKAAEILPLALSGQLTWQQAADQIALWAGAEIQKYISDGHVSPGDSAKTIARKGSSTPLIDRNLLRSAISGEAILT
jgi:hypothetical protein